MTDKYTADDLVICRSDMGDGGWSIHAPDATDEDIAFGEALTLATGTSRRRDGVWLRPSARDIRRAWRKQAAL